MTQANFFKTRIWNLEDTTDGPRIVIPSPFLWPLSIFFGFWLGGWTMGEISAIKGLWQLANSANSWVALLPGVFMLFWLAGWTVGGVFAWSVFLFSIQGREVVTLDGTMLRVRLETLLGLHWSWRFNLAEMEAPQLMVMDVGDSENAQRIRAAGGMLPDYSGIKLKAGKKTWRLGLGISQPAAKELMYTLHSRFGLPRAAADAQPEIIQSESSD